MTIPFIDLQAQKARIRPQLDQAMARVMDHGAFIMGPEVFELERRLGDFSGSPYVLSCSNGTDALSMILMAKDVGPGDAVFVPAFTFVATAEVVALRGATPVFVDVLGDTFNMDPHSLTQAIDVAKKAGLTPRGVIAVDLFGQPADYDVLEPVAEAHGLWVMADAAQSFGATYKGVRAGSRVALNTTSFFPAKPLGAYGDGGAVFVKDAELYGILKSIRVHGQGQDKYENVRLGLTGRLDTLQAAVLMEKLAIFEDELEARGRVAARYNGGLQDVCETPVVLDGCRSSWAQYTIKVAPELRENLIQTLGQAGIPSVVYYRMGLHHQKGYSHFPRASETLPVTEALAHQVLSLPMHPYLDAKTQDTIIEVVRRTLLSLAA